MNFFFKKTPEELITQVRGLYSSLAQLAVFDCWLVVHEDGIQTGLHTFREDLRALIIFLKSAYLELLRNIIFVLLVLFKDSFRYGSIRSMTFKRQND